MRTLKSCFVLLVAAVAGQVMAGSFSKTWTFELDKWYEINSSDGPVTIHKMRLEPQSGGLTKSKFFRPGNSQHLKTIQVQIEFSNSSKHDWEADLDISWVDADGKVIDGYKDSEGMNEDENHDRMTVTLSTLQYGLDRAKKLVVKIDYERD